MSSFPDERAFDECFEDAFSALEREDRFSVMPEEREDGMTPICFGCRVTMRCEKNGQMMVDRPGFGYAATYWSGDLYRCPQCGTQIVTGFSRAIYDVNERDEAEAAVFGYQPRSHGVRQAEGGA